MIEVKTELFPWQKDAVEKLRKLKVGALYMDMSTGKTRTGLELIRLRLEAGKVDGALWLCPINTARELPALLDEHAAGWRPYIEICGIETLSTSVRRNSELLELAREKKLFLIVDESTMVKNPEALRTKHITTIARLCPYRLILSGTPVTRNEADLFSQWYLLDWRILGYRSYFSFAKNHLQYDEYGKVRRTLNVDYLTEKIAPYTFEVRREDCFTLPKKKYDVKEFWMTDEQQKVYDDATNRLIDLIDERKPETLFRLFNACQAVTAGCYLIFDGAHFDTFQAFEPEDNPRIQALMEVLNEKIPPDEKVLINCKYTHEILAILQVLNRHQSGIAVPYYGDISGRQRSENLAKFKKDAQFLVANKSCAEYGLNLQFAHNIVFYDNDWDYATRLQAEDRMHRLGQTHELRIFDIVCRDTIDETIQDCLSRKSGLVAEFNRGVKEKQRLLTMVKGEYRG